MARCQRCNACRSMWDAPLCGHCGFPEKDIRTLEQKRVDFRDWIEYYYNLYQVESIEDLVDVPDFVFNEFYQMAQDITNEAKNE